MNSENLDCTPWKNGYYRIKGLSGKIYCVEGEDVTMESASGIPTNQNDPCMKGTWKYGDFGEAHPDVVKETGKKCYNVEIILYAGRMKMRAVVSDDGRKLTFYGFANDVDYFEWQSEEELVVYKETGDPANAPPSHYTIQPENQGKLLWISGAPGLGKSTSGHLLSKKAGYVYYEADAFLRHLNPYIPPEADEPTTAALKQNFLKGVPQERIDAVADGVYEFMAMCKDNKYDFKKLSEFYLEMSKDIAKERKRIGGDWVVAQAVPTRALRDCIRAELGPDLIFVVLNMSKDDQVERLKARHGDKEVGITDMLVKLSELYEPASEDEPNAIDVLLTNDMTRDDVVDKILQMLKNY